MLTPVPLVAGAAVACRRGDTLVLAVTGLGDLTGRDQLWFTVKRSRAYGDPAALVRIEEGAGLLVLLGEVAEESLSGSLVVDDEAAGEATLRLEAVAAATLVPARAYVYDFQVRFGAEVTTIADAAFHVTGDVTHAVE